MSTLQKIQIQGPGLKKQGIVVLQFLFIGFFVFVEMTIRTGVGILTGIAICAATFGSLRFGRPGTTYVSAVTPPLAFAGSALFSRLCLMVLDLHELELISSQLLHPKRHF